MFFVKYLNVDSVLSVLLLLLPFVPLPLGRHCSENECEMCLMEMQFLISKSLYMFNIVWYGLFNIGRPLSNLKKKLRAFNCIVCIYLWHVVFVCSFGECGGLTAFVLVVASGKTEVWTSCHANGFDWRDSCEWFLSISVLYWWHSGTGGGLDWIWSMGHS